MRVDWRRERFLEWLCTAPKDRMPDTQYELAEELGCDRQMLTEWKKDAEFLALWEKRYRQTIGSPERAGQVMQSLYETAIDRTVWSDVGSRNRIRLVPSLMIKYCESLVRPHPSPV